MILVRGARQAEKETPYHLSVPRVEVCCGWGLLGPAVKHCRSSPSLRESKTMRSSGLGHG